MRLRLVAGGQPPPKRPSMKDVAQWLQAAARVEGTDPAEAARLRQEATDLATALCYRPGGRVTIDFRDPDYRRGLAKKSDYEIALNATKIVKFDGGRVGAEKRLAEIVGRELAPHALDYMKDRLAAIRSHVAAALSELLLRLAEARGDSIETVKLIRVAEMVEIIDQGEEDSDTSAEACEMGEGKFRARGSGVQSVVEYPDASSEGFEAPDFRTGEPSVAPDVYTDGAPDMAPSGRGSTTDDADQASGLSY